MEIYREKIGNYQLNLIEISAEKLLFVDYEIIWLFNLILSFIPFILKAIKNFFSQPKANQKLQRKYEILREFFFFLNMIYYKILLQQHSIHNILNGYCKVSAIFQRQLYKYSCNIARFQGNIFEIFPQYFGAMWEVISLIKWPITTIVLGLKEIRYCSIVARRSLKTLAYHSLPKYWMQKIQKSWNKMCDN